MTAVFLGIWILYTLFALYRNVYGRSGVSMTAQMLQFALILLSLRWAWVSGMATRSLWSPLDILAGLILGHLLFALSLWITHQHLDDVGSHLVDGRGIIAFAGKTPEVFIRFLSIAAAEELVYRVAAQDMLQDVFGHPAPAIAISAAGFCLLHDHFFKNGVFSALEFILFTLVISVLYYYTSSFTLVALMHLVRNLESAYLEYCVLLEDTHDEAEALRLLNARHASFAMESI